MANILKGKVKIPGIGSVPTVYVVGIVGTLAGVAALYIMNDQFQLGLELPTVEGEEAGEIVQGVAKVVVFTITPAQTFQGSKITVAGQFLDDKGSPTTVPEAFYTILEDGREIRAIGSLGNNVSSFNAPIPIPHSMRDGAYDLYVSDHQLTASEIAQRVRVPVNQPILNLPPGLGSVAAPGPLVPSSQYSPVPGVTVN